MLKLSHPTEHKITSSGAGTVSATGYWVRKRGTQFVNLSARSESPQAPESSPPKARAPKQRNSLAFVLLFPRPKGPTEIRNRSAPSAASASNYITSERLNNNLFPVDISGHPGNDACAAGRTHTRHMTRARETRRTQLGDLIISMAHGSISAVTMANDF